MKKLVNHFIDVICCGVGCTTDKCACRIGGGCEFDNLSDRELANIARDRFIKKGCPPSLEESMAIINRAYPSKAVIL